MKIAKLTLLVFLFILSSILSCSKNNFDKTKLEPIDLSKINISDLPYKFEILKSYTRDKNVSVFPADLDNDGKDEIIQISNVRGKSASVSFVTALTLDPQRTVFQTNFNGFINCQPISFDINKDGQNEMFISESIGDSTYVNILNSKGKVIDRFLGATNPHVSNRKWFCPIYPEAFIDINTNSFEEILFSLVTDYAYQPRGVFAYDFKNKEVIWEYRTGFVPNFIRLLDINGTGNREILFGSSAPGNGVGKPVNGTDDSKVYLTALDSLGNLLKRQKVGSESSAAYLYVNDLNADNQNEIIVNYTSNKDTAENSFVALWDPITKNIAPKISKPNNLSLHMAFLDADKDGKDDMLIAWQDGVLEFRNDKFEKILSRKFINLTPSSLFLSDFNNDGEKEIIVCGQFKGRHVIVLLNNKMEILSYFDQDFYVSHEKIVSTGFGKEKMLIATDVDRSRKVLLQIKRHYKILTLAYWKTLGSGILIGLFISGLIFVFYYFSKLQQKLKISLQSIFSSLPDGMAILDHKGNIVAINRSLEQLFKIREENVKGLAYKKIFSDNKYKELNIIIESSYGDNYSFLNKEINFVQNGNLTNLIIEIVTTKLVEYKNPFKLLIVRDITSSVQSTRTIAWATMAQKLAHEIKTPLSTVMLTAQRLELGFKNDAELHNKFGKYVSKIIRQVDRLRQLTDSFLKFAKIEKPKVEQLNLNNLIANVINDLQIIIGTNIEIRKAFTEDIPLIRVDRNQILIAIKNIINNSLKAMGGEGIITITTRLVQSLHKQVGQISKNNIQIEIADTGKGISKQDMGQLFQPFFSKSPGGTGLGLVIVKKIIEDHNGSIKIESEEGIGTTVLITLLCTE